MIIPISLSAFIFWESYAQIVTLDVGKVKGFAYKTAEGDIAGIFLNIPYSEPTLENLRFRKPRIPKDWTEIRDGTKFGPVCHPIVREAVPFGAQASEECLTLNIVRPKKKPPLSGYPILFWIHGGGFNIGSALDAGYKSFADIYVPFVYGNAAYIGGDQSRITVWGHSAGAGAAGQLILSLITRDMVNQSIEMSGSAWASWALGANVVKNSMELVKLFECDRNIRGCLRKKSPDEIHDAVQKLKYVELVYTGNDAQSIIDDLVSYYVDKGEEKNYEFYIDRYTQFINDAIFNVPIVDGILSRRKAGWTIYAYFLDHYNDAIWNDRVPKRLRGAAHASEFPYINGMHMLGDFEFDENEQRIADISQQSIIEFVKSGIVVNQHEIWHDTGKGAKLEYLRIAPHSGMKQGLNNDKKKTSKTIRSTQQIDILQRPSTSGTNTSGQKGPSTVHFFGICVFFVVYCFQVV
ncbi:unnamed protein product [Cylicocyclus nassatus]|uniref:Carboxylesterase type B domain-containing protein n=1 Tax=Cylicocyclus nassatus TaxID=53992 RepID=A0AA36DNA5_CYLNA|nr:unnamed protein product [Cylicocyclus nassatus]